ncbi:MAG TPA: hypothetical protein PKZ36_03215 [Candidatus Paceibacterota bacterium]|nr:hypothetical protein [Candidatus Paceibacterota bacterium]HPT18388.1 hypothetical protein [Candidatus Paceibacterota bacterium]
MTWASKRQLLYSSIIIIIILFFCYLIVKPFINKEPTCTDGKQNGTETGVDCGGSCSRACTLEVDEISVLWSRVFKVVDGRYNAVAYLENHNPNTAIKKISYRFRFADKDNIYIGKREGETFIPPGGKIAVFEPAIDVGNSIPVYVSFEFTESPTWIQVSNDLINQLQISVSNIRLENENSSPKLFATIKNTSLFRIPEVSFVVILYDELGNAINASHTYLELMTKEEVKDISFTWPLPISDKVVEKEIIPMFDIFSAKLK